MKARNAEMKSQQAGQQSNMPRVRTRQGCRRCRQRRRKCDEGKPHCQNCIRKGINCEYGVHLTFHDANILGLDDEEAKNLREHGPERYERVQFIDGNKNVQKDVEQNYSDQEEMPHLMSNDIDPPVEQIHLATHYLATGLTPLEGSHPDHENNVTSEISEVDDIAGTPMRLSSSTGMHLDTITTGLNQHEDTGIHEDSLHPASNPENEIDFGCSIFSSDLRVYTSRIRSLPRVRNSKSATSSSNCQMLDSSANQGLVKYYIDHVAPWLEVNSFEALYSIYIPLMSSKYNPLRQSIIALVLAQARGFGATLGDTILEASLRSLGSDMYTRHEEPILTRQLLLITRILPLPMKEWHSVLLNGIPNFNELGIHGLLGGFRGSSSWLVLRFDIAVAVNSRQQLVTNLANWQEGNSPSTQSINSFPRSKYLQEALLLCANIVNLWQSAGSNADIDCWTQYLAELQTLKNGPSSEMSIPIVSFAIGKTSCVNSSLISSTCRMPTSFPISIYTNRLFFYFQTLNHLTHILLTQCKPHQIPGRSAKNLKTAPWHAVQLCGLALSNPILWSWDPVVVASLLFAGSFLSYSEQQTELLQYLKQLRRTTGWKFDQEIKDLEDFWKIDY